MELVEHFISDKGTFTSASDVVRQALEFFHDKTYPNYIFRLSPTQQLKAQELESKKEAEALPNEQFALENLKALVLPDTTGKLFFIIYWFQSKEFAHFPLEEVKTWFLEEANKAAINKHLEFSKDVLVKDFPFTNYTRQYFERDYGIILPGAATDAPVL